MPEPLFSDARRVLDRLADNPQGCSVSIRGVDGLFRAKHTGRARVAWAWCAYGDHSVPLVDSIVRRDDRTYGRAGVFAREINAAIASEDWDALDEFWSDGDPGDAFAYETDQTPAFAYDGGDGAAFKRYVYRDFSRSPRLTAAQEADYRDLLHRADSDVIALQGGAGSGKSTFALLAACRIASAPGPERRHVIFLAPPALVERFRLFREARYVYGSPPLPGGITTVADWLHSCAPGAPPPSPLRTRFALQDAAETARRANLRHQGQRPPETVSDLDVLLYEAFLLGSTGHKDAAGVPYAERLLALGAIPPRFWTDALAAHDASSRTALASAVTAALPEPPPGATRALLVVDEAQDLLVAEVQAIKETWQHWNERGCQTLLWFLGDTNQRITPSGFTWDALAHLGIHSAPQTLRRNYRNTRAVLHTASAYHARAQTLAADQRARRPAPPSRPGPDTPDGDPVRYVVLPDAQAVSQAITALSGVAADDRERSLRAHLSKQLQVLAPTPRPDVDPASALVHTPASIKGSELEAAVAVGVFDLPDSLHAVNGGYTLVTRVRRRLLFLLTQAELPAARALGVLDGAEETTVDQSTGWITEWGSVLDLSAEPERTFAQLADGSPLGAPWLDTWEILSEIGLQDQADTWEERIAHVAAGGWGRVATEADCRWLRAVALRRSGRLAEAEASVLDWAGSGGAPPTAEADRQWDRIAQALRDVGRPYEAHRLLARHRTGYQVPPDLPFTDADPHGPLRRAVADATLRRLRAMLPTD